MADRATSTEQDQRGVSRQEVGGHGEDLAAALLLSEGLEILNRNWRCPIGELDIVALETGRDDRRTVVFCEVKTRRGRGYGGPLEAITRDKVRKLRHLAARWLLDAGVHADEIRLDAIGVMLMPGCAPELTHVQGIGG